MRKKSELRHRALKVAEKIAKSFLEEYSNGPYVKELSTDRVRFFYFTSSRETLRPD